MPFAALIIGAIIIVVALNNTHADLARELESDLPGFFKWGIAIAVILGLGFIPGLRTPSRWLLALIVVVVVLTQFTAIKNGILNFASTGASAGGMSAAATGGAEGGASPGNTATPLSANPAPADFLTAFNPADFLTAAVGAFG